MAAPAQRQRKWCGAITPDPAPSTTDSVRGLAILVGHPFEHVHRSAGLELLAQPERPPHRACPAAPAPSSTAYPRGRSGTADADRHPIRNSWCESGASERRATRGVRAQGHRNASTPSQPPTATNRSQNRFTRAQGYLAIESRSGTINDDLHPTALDPIFETPAHHRHTSPALAPAPRAGHHCGMSTHASGSSPFKTRTGSQSRSPLRLDELQPGHVPLGLHSHRLA